MKKKLFVVSKQHVLSNGGGVSVVCPTPDFYPILSLHEVTHSNCDVSQVCEGLVIRSWLSFASCFFFLL